MTSGWATAPRSWAGEPPPVDEDGDFVKESAIGKLVTVVRGP